MMNLTTTLQSFMPLLPVIIVSLTAVLAMLAIAVKRNHFVVGTITVLGLNIALFILGKEIYQAYANHTPIASSSVTAMFMVDSFSKVFMALILLAGLACATLSHAYISGFKANKEELYLLLLCAIAGAMLLTASQNLAGFFVSLELMSISVIGMVAYTYEREITLEAGVKYIVSSATASAGLLMGMALIYAQTGSLDYYTVGSSLVRNLNSIFTIIGITLMIGAIGFKLSLAPFHYWTADVYQGAPAPVTTFLATVSKVAVMVALIRFFLVGAPLAMEGVRTVLYVLITLSIIVGNVMAARQSSLKRLLAFSSVAHVGYMLIPLVSMGAMSLGTISFYLITYVIVSIATFGAVALMSSEYDGDEADHLSNYRGLFWRHPVLTTVLTVMMLALAGVPTTTGLIAKFLVFMSAMPTGQWYLLALLILGSVIGLYYYLRVLVVMFMTPAKDYHIDSRPNWGIHAGGVVVILATLFTVAFGLYPEPLIAFTAKMIQITPH